MKPTICLFEDQKVENFLPLSFTRPVYDLRCGILSFRERVQLCWPQSNIELHSRTFLHTVLESRTKAAKISLFESEVYILINGRLFLDSEVIKRINKLNHGDIIVRGTDIIAAKVFRNDLLNNFEIENHLLLKPNHHFNIIQYDALLADYTWDLINNNFQQIINDVSLLKLKPVASFKKLNNVAVKNQKNIYIGKNVEIDPYVFLDASDGPIVLDDNSKIMSHSSIQGPAYIGKNSIVKMHAAIYHGTSIGEVCKVGGEVEATIIHSFSNKQHEGFLGHSYLGSWVNLGASTNNSDLKNNYSTVSVQLNHKNVDTGSQFMGLIMGDHSKTAINTMFNTGTIVGVSCNIFGAGFPPRYIPSFSWGGSDFLKIYDISKCLEVAEIVYNRRKLELTKNEVELLKSIFEMTKAERSKRLVD